LVTTGTEQAVNDPDLADKLNEPEAQEVLTWLYSVRERSYRRWSQGPDRLEDLMAAAAPGPASEPPGRWLGQVGTAPGLSAPELWRIGSFSMTTAAGNAGSATSFDVAVPLLDESHLAITSGPRTRTQVDALVENLLLRILSTFEPGAVRIHLWDT